MPDIFDGSIIIGCATTEGDDNMRSATILSLHERAVLTSLLPHFLQNSASLSFRVPHHRQRIGDASAERLRAFRRRRGLPVCAPRALAATSLAIIAS